MKRDADELLKWVECARKPYEDWEAQGKTIIQRYAQESALGQNGQPASPDAFNILWSNVETLKPALYSRMPLPAIERRFGDSDPVARTACMILERAAKYEIECYPDFNSAMQAVVLDRLLPGRGVAWVRYDPTFKEVEAQGEATITDDAPEEAPGTVEVIDYERSPIDYIHWQDFFVDAVRTWEEVNRVARRVLMKKDAGKKRFGKKFVDAAFDAKPDSIDAELRKALDTEEGFAEVYEIWDKADGKVYWVAKGLDVLLDEADDPLKIEGFFPCPKPLFATTTNESLVPTPDFAQYVAQAAELDEITERINSLTQSLKVIGVYAAEEKGVMGQMFDGGTEPKMIPVDSWAAFADKGGIKGMIDWFPVDMVVNVLQSLYVARDQLKQTIYELTGISDIVRGASVATETATAQQIKGKYANMRLSASQQDVAQFAQDLIRIKVNIMAAKYSPQTLIDQSGIMETDDADKAEQAMALIKSGKFLSFRVSVNADDLSEMRQMQVKQDRNEFLTAVGGYMSQVQGLLAQAPELTQLAGRLLMYGIQSFPQARELEGSFETAMQQFFEANQQRQAQQGQQTSTEQQKLVDGQAARGHELQKLAMERDARAQEAEADRQFQMAMKQADQQKDMATTAKTIAEAEKIRQETIALEMQNAKMAHEGAEELSEPANDKMSDDWSETEDAA